MDTSRKKKFHTKKNERQSTGSGRTDRQTRQGKAKQYRAERVGRPREYRVQS